MAEAMIPPEKRSNTIMHIQDVNIIGSREPDNENILEFQENMKRKRSNNNVIIAIPAEIKRHKIAHLCDADTTRRIVEDISTAVNRRERLSAIGAACAAFNHDVTSKHDEELQNHCADAVLCKHLSFLLLKAKYDPCEKIRTNEFTTWWVNSSRNICQSQFDEADEEIRYTCSALEMIFRGSASFLSKTYDKLGPELLDLLLAVIYRKATTKKESTKNDINENSIESCTGVLFNQTGQQNNLKFIDTNQLNSNMDSSNCIVDISIRKATKIMCHFARVGSAVERMAHHPGVLKVLKDIINKRYNQKSGGKIIEFPDVDEESSINCLWILGNLACTPENMARIMNYPGINITLLQVLKSCNITNSAIKNSPTYQKSVATVGQVVRIFHNLSWTNVNKTTMSGNGELIDEIIKLICPLHQISFSSIDNIVKSMFISARRHAIGTLRNIAATPSFTEKVNLCQHGCGTLFIALSKVLKNKVHVNNIIEGDEEDLVMKERALATIYNLTCKDTINSIVMCSDLLEALSQVSATLGKYVGDTKTIMEKIFLSLKENVASDMECFDALIEFLDKNKNGTESTDTQTPMNNTQFIQYASI